MKKNNAILILIMFLAGIMVVTSCKKDDDDDEPENTTVPHSDMNDDSTTSIKVTIPRIEVNPARASEITVFLSVTDQDGNPLKNFNQYNFLIKQACAGDTDSTIVGSLDFSTLNQEGSDIAAAMTLDYSGSMSSQNITDMEDAVTYFINLKDPSDMAEIIKFASDIDVVTPFTNNAQTLIDGVNTSVSIGIYTSFFDAIDVGLDDADSLLNTGGDYLPAIVAFTDGGDNDSHVTLSEVITKANNFQVPIYTLGFGSVDEQVMNELADESGGRYYYSPNSAQIQDLYTLISGQLKNMYVVTWTYDDPTCTEVVVVVRSSYTCANGTFHSFATKYFTPLK
ncbi:MAG: VWA domain-containing protein [Bacteroidales bacterium]